MIETLLENKVRWLAGDGPQGGRVVYSRCVLSRNLADFPFPARCSMDERSAIEERLLGAMADWGWEYLSFQKLNQTKGRMLVERDVAGSDLARAEGPRGVLVNEDQSLSVSINGEDHLAIRGTGPGLELSEVWRKVSAVEDLLTETLDFAYDERLGYLTSSIHNVGTGLKASAALHVPFLLLSNQLGGIKKARAKLYDIASMFKKQPGTKCPLQRISNVATLGRSEEETIFHLKQLVQDIMEREDQALAAYQVEMPEQLADDVGRALGLARGARLLAFEETVSILSSIRTGIALGLAEGCSIAQINALLVEAQHAHVKRGITGECNELALNRERARLVRSRLTPEMRN